MLEITTRQFKLEPGEFTLGELCKVFEKMPGYIPGSMTFYDGDKVRADFAVKVI